jgi:cytoskeletal protein RodZ
MYPDPKYDMDDNEENQEATESKIEPEEHEEGDSAESGAKSSSLPVNVTPGKYLLTEREKAGLNRARVGQALGLTETAVKNLETNDFELFPGSVYVRGYLKNYAKLLGTDEDELIAIYDRYCADHQLDNGRSTADLSAMPASKRNNKAMVAMIISGVVVVVLAVVIFNMIA